MAECLCKSCVHELYGDMVPDWVNCNHPTTRARTPAYDKDAPAWVDFMTTDLRIEQAIEFRMNDCRTYEPQTANPADGDQSETNPKR